MSWYSESWQRLYSMHSRAKRDGYGPLEMAKFLDECYPWRSRSGHAYKAWLSARKDFFRKHNLPLRRAKPPAPDLFS